MNNINSKLRLANDEELAAYRKYRDIKDQANYICNRRFLSDEFEILCQQLRLEQFKHADILFKLRK